MEGAKKRAKKLFNEHTRNEEDNSGPRMVVVGAREKECSPLFDTSQNLRIDPKPKEKSRGSCQKKGGLGVLALTPLIIKNRA